jgi:hypothetical protein
MKNLLTGQQSCIASIEYENRLKRKLMHAVSRDMINKERKHPKQFSYTYYSCL